eukprot:TRINITY_DN1920_c0_g2_i1.p1 TRINITY_DN1920_c0_g2~~TRINITY_DN1920_c0_g2_i1.p1  ORF type:complete len:350 (-),score=57.87 TRINITY_DN1920_c0_g2_i1:545-1594(-)
MRIHRNCAPDLQTSEMLALSVIFALFLCSDSAQVVWRRGDAAQIAVYNDSSYTVSVQNPSGGYDLWLQNASISVYCNNVWHSTGDGSLLLRSSGDSEGAHPYLGIFVSYTFIWLARDSVSETPYETSFLYFPTYDFFVFTQSFPVGANGTSAPQTGTTKPGYEFGSATIPSSRFPSFTTGAPSLLNELGMLCWQGRFAYDDVKWGVGLSQFEGGEEAGPLVLFDAAPATGLRPRALVYSSFDNFKTAITSPPVADGASTSIGSGISGRVASLPVQFTVSFALFASLQGINDAVHEWGVACRSPTTPSASFPTLSPTNSATGRTTGPCITMVTGTCGRKGSRLRRTFSSA